MSISVWGVDHGDEVSKKDRYNSNEKTGALLGGTVHPLQGFYAGSKAKKGNQAKVGFRAVGRSMVEGTAGGMAGGAIGAAASRGNPVATQVGASLGGYGGFAHGTAESMRNSRKRGWMKGKK